MRKLKAKIDEIVIKAYVIYTIKMWEIEDYMRDVTDELKTKMSK